MFNSLFKKKKIKNQYLVLGEMDLPNDEYYIDFVKVHNASKNTALKFEMFRELVFENGKLVKTYSYEDQIKYDRILIKQEKGLPYIDCAENKFLSVIPNENGVNQLGGKLPSDINFENTTDIKFQYLGFISNKNNDITFLKDTLHLLAPIYTDFEKIYLDYSISNTIKLIDVDSNLSEIEEVYDILKNSNKNIVYDILKFDFQEVDELGDYGNSGIPLWLQYPEIPKCPKTGVSMKFLFQVFTGPKIIESPESFEEDKMQIDWGTGYLYIFFCPESQIACYLFQGT